MDLKKLLKKYKLNESTISMILGALVIIVAGMLIVNYFRGLDKGSTLPTVETTQEDTLPTTHTVVQGEDLWKIAETYYQDGYKWVDIAQENNITNPNQIEEGQELVIPALAEVEELAEATITPAITLEPTATIEPTQEPSATLAPTQTPEPTKVAEVTQTVMEQKPETTPSTEVAISGDTYTVVHGDSLWKIAQRAYGDGNKWTEIAKANKLVNPSVIHTGNIFVIPR